MTEIKCLRCGSYVTHIASNGNYLCDYCKFEWGEYSVVKKSRRKKA